MLQSDSSDSGGSSATTVSSRTRNAVLPAFEQKRQKFLPGGLQKPPRNPPWYSAHILEEERPDLAGASGKLQIEKEEAVLLDVFIRSKADLLGGDLIITNDNLDEDDRKFNRYIVQLKYNEGRYTSLYLISQEVCASNETVLGKTLYAMKTSIRPYSVNILLRMKREIRILNELKAHKCPYSPIVLDSGRIADLPFIVMNLLDRNFEKLREQTVAFLPSTAYYVAHELMSALAFLHSLNYIHRDVKPSNVCAGAAPMNTRIYLIDYGDTVKFGKRIRYGTPDGYTLPYWSLDSHRHGAARHKTDVESWFYVLIELLAPGSLPWAKLNKVADVESEKVQFWEGKRFMLDSPYVFALFNLIRNTSSKFDHQRAIQITREALKYCLKGPMRLEWAPGAHVDLPQPQGPQLVDSRFSQHKSVKQPDTEPSRSKLTDWGSMERSVEEQSQESVTTTQTERAETGKSLTANVSKNCAITRREAPGENVNAVVISESSSRKPKKHVAAHIPSLTTTRPPPPQRQHQGQRHHRPNRSRSQPPQHHPGHRHEEVSRTRSRHHRRPRRQHLRQQQVNQREDRPPRARHHRGNSAIQQRG